MKEGTRLRVKLEPTTPRQRAILAYLDSLPPNGANSYWVVLWRLLCAGWSALRPQSTHDRNDTPPN